jgi:urease beta subunit
MNLYSTPRRKRTQRHWFTDWTAGLFGKRRRPLRAETLEQRQMLASDLFAISRMAFIADGYSSPAALETSGEESFIAPQSLEAAAGEKIRVRLEVQNLDEQPVTQLAPGAEFVLRAYVTDLRAEPEGVFSAYVDVTYPTALVSSQAGSGDGVVNEAPYTNDSSGDANTAGLINEAGGFANSTSPLGGGERLLFTVLMRANSAGVATFTLDPADEVGNDMSVYGEDLGVPNEEVEFVNTTLTIGNPLPTISINSVQVSEADDEIAIAELTVTLSEARDEAVFFDYATANGTATAGADYEAITAGQLFFAPGETTATINVPVLPDNDAEGNETFTVTLSNADGATISQGVGTVTILDDDAAPPTIAINDVTKLEGNSGETTFDFTVTLSAAAAGTVTVDYTTIPGTATAGTDYETASGTVTFNAGETSKTVTITVLGDTAIEEAETFTVALSNAVGGTIADNVGLGTISNDDSVLPTLTINDPTVAEGDSGFVDLIYTVTLSTASATDVTVDYATAAGTATAATDFESKTGTLTIAAGQTTGTITVRIIGDEADEANETVLVNLTNATGATIIDAEGTGTINDDDETPLPTLSIADVSVEEGDSGQTAMTFTVTLSAAATSDVTVGFNTASGTADAGTDFEATNGTLTFAAGETTKTIVVNVLGDTAFESDETFTVTLANPVGATIPDATATGTIENDDELGPAFSVSDAEVAEGDSGTVNVTFTVTLSEALSTQATVNYATASGTALGQGATADFTPTNGTLTFAAGETTKTVTVAVVGDLLDEDNETFRLVLSDAVGAAIADGEGTATIIDGDATPSLTINNVTVVEEVGTNPLRGMVFTITLSAASGRTVTVKYATSDGTATAGQDYNATSGTLTFAPGETTKTINVPIRSDSIQESDEKLTVTLSEATNATIGDGTGEGTIDDNDTGPQISIADLTVTEGDEGNTQATFTVTLSAVSGLPVIVDFATAAGTALAASDYITTSGELTFNPGETSKTITVQIVGDRFNEATETFTVRLSNATFATILDDTATGTITDNDPLPSLAIGNVTLTEGDSGTLNAVFTVTLTGSSSTTVTVAYATADGTATAGSDYAATSGTLTFAPGETSKTISVPVNGDQFEELNETFVVNLTSPTQATIGTAQGTATITNNDEGPIEGEAASVAGSVYLDVNQNGARDAGEAGLANITIRLTGTDRLGQAVDLTALTNAAGDYFFANLLPGQYTLSETHPVDYLDGLESIGTMGGTTAGDQIFFNLGAGQNATGYHFGEVGLTPGNITRRNFIVG